MRILHLEDNPDDAELVRRIIISEWPGCVIQCVATEKAFAAELNAGSFDLIMSDFDLPGFDGFEALKIARAKVPETPFLFVSGTIGEDRAIEALRQGADDYVLKDRLKRLGTAVKRAVRESAEREQRRRAEARIREQAEMLNQAREAIFSTDLENRVIYWNAGAERMLGWTAAEVVGRPAEQLMDPSMLPPIQAARQQTLEQGQWTGELRMQTKDRDMIVVESRQTLIRDENGRPKARLCINSNITERKRLEQQFLRAQRMENLGLLAAGIAHDLNNMLAPILLASPMLREHVASGPPQVLLDTLERSAERGAMLVRQILSFAHGVGGERQIVQVKHLMRDILSVITGTFPKSIRLVDYVPSDLWPVHGNPTQVHQVLLNLSVNARDAMPAGGVLTLKGENVVFTEEQAQLIDGARAGAFLRITVEDTGTGIPPELLKRIWEPFFTTKEAGRGTGLGLSTVRGIVDAHQGFIQVQSTPGVGSSFRIYLPAAEHGEPMHDPAKLKSLPRGRGELILVVDDEPEIREMTSVILGRQGYRVLLACDGAEAASLFAQRAAEIRLVISDLHMPNLDGAMLGRALKRINPNTRVLMMSGLASGLGTKSEYRPDEFSDALLMKPFNPHLLLEKVDELLHRSAGLSGNGRLVQPRQPAPQFRT